MYETAQPNRDGRHKWMRTESQKGPGASTTMHTSLNAIVSVVKKSETT